MSFPGVKPELSSALAVEVSAFAMR
jgi:hypothetical protein